VLGVGACYWALVPKVESAGSSRARSTEAPRAHSGRDRAAAEPPRVEESAEVARAAGDSEDASVARTVEERKAELDALFAEPHVPQRLSTVLAAVADEPTPPEQDPLWQQVVASLAEVWRGDALTRGLDLMLAETRPRARRALVSSFAFLANSEAARQLTPAQSQTLSNDFIDMYKQLPAAQQPEVLSALRKVAGPDVADILVGRTSELERQYQRDLESVNGPAGRAARNPRGQ
jgi:hypothetical protein